MKRLRKGTRVLVTGGTGLIGRNLTRKLKGLGCRVTSVGSEFDLRRQARARALLREAKPEVLFHLAAKVGGIYANMSRKEEFYYDNVMINTNVVREALGAGVPYLFAMGTGCAYPKRLESGLLRERDFLDGVPEVTNDAYAYAKRGLLVHLKAAAESRALRYVFCLPANIYGPHDNYHPEHSHVVPGLIRRFYEAKKKGAPAVKVWGDGSARRDFLYIDDCLDGMIRIANSGFGGTVNIATGKLTTVKKLAATIKQVLAYEGKIEFEKDFPAGQMRRLFDTSAVRRLKWEPKTELGRGIRLTCDWFDANYRRVREC